MTSLDSVHNPSEHMYEVNKEQNATALPSLGTNSPQNMHPCICHLFTTFPASKLGLPNEHVNIGCKPTAITKPHQYLSFTSQLVAKIRTFLVGITHNANIFALAKNTEQQQHGFNQHTTMTTAIYSPSSVTRCHKNVRMKTRQPLLCLVECLACLQ